jgi:hypothetical protein
MNITYFGMGNLQQPSVFSPSGGDVSSMGVGMRDKSSPQTSKRSTIFGEGFKK